MKWDLSLYRFQLRQYLKNDTQNVFLKHPNFQLLSLPEMESVCWQKVWHVLKWVKRFLLYWEWNKTIICRKNLIRVYKSGRSWVSPRNLKLRSLILNLYKMITSISTHCFVIQPEDDSYQSRKFRLVIEAQKMALELFCS